MTHLTNADIALITSSLLGTKAMMSLSIGIFLLLPVIIAFSGGGALRFMQYYRLLLEQEYERANPTPKSVTQPVKAKDIMRSVPTMPSPSPWSAPYDQGAVKRAFETAMEMAVDYYDGYTEADEALDEMIAIGRLPADAQMLPYCDDEDGVIIGDNGFNGQMLPA